MDVHFRLEEERKRLGLDQEKMAEAGGVKLRAYGYYVSGERPPSSRFMEGIAKAGADVQYILTGQRGVPLADRYHRQSAEGIDSVLERMASVIGKDAAVFGYAQLFDVTEKTLSEWRKQDAVSRDYLVGFAREHGVTTEYLLTGEHRVENPVAAYAVEQLPDDFILLPRHDVRAGAGGGQVVLNDKSVIDHLAFKREWITRTLGLDPRQAVLIEVHGDSMQPTLSDGDLILVDMRNGQPGRSGVYVIQLGNHLQVKRLAPRLDGSVDVKSDNPAYGSEHLARDAAESLTVIGRVVWSGRKI